MRKFLCITLIALCVGLIASLSYAQTEKQSYAEVKGQVLNEWRMPLGGVTVTMVPVTNGYATSSYSASTDPNGHYEITNVARFLYSKGTDPQVVDYYVTVNYPGYPSYTSETFNFKDSSTETVNIRLTGGSQS